MRKSRKTIRIATIRKQNDFLRNLARATESVELANIILGAIIRTETGKVVMKGGSN